MKVSLDGHWKSEISDHDDTYNYIVHATRLNVYVPISVETRIDDMGQ